MRHILRWIPSIRHIHRQASSTTFNHARPSTGGVNLAKVGIATCTLGSAVYIYATARQINHINSAEYVPPAEWSKSVKDTSVSSELEKAKHQLRYGILLESAEWIIVCGLLLGGYNRLWRMSTRAAKVFTKGPETLRGRLVSNGLFAASNIAIMVTTELASSRAYQQFTNVPVKDSTTSLKDTLGAAGRATRTLTGRDETEKLSLAGMWPDWQNWALLGGIGTLVVGIPLVVSVAVYERLGPKAIRPMTRALVVVAGCTGAAVYVSDTLSRRRHAETSIYYGQCTDLVEWSQHTPTNFNIAELASGIRDMLGPGPELKLVVMPDRSSKVEAEELRGLLNFLIQEHPGHPYAHPKQERPSQRYVCLWPQHLKNLDLDVNLALIADTLTEDMKPPPWQNIKFSVFSAISLAAICGIAHLSYARTPALLLSIFPSLQREATRHIPLMVSLTTTSAILPLLWPVDWLWHYMCNQEIYDRDRVIAGYGPEVVRGWQKLLLMRGQAWEQMDEGAAIEPDTGTADPLYAFVRPFDTGATERIVALNKLPREPSALEVQA